MDFALTPELEALRERVRTFIAEQVIPLENDPRQDSHGPHKELREELIARARAAGLLAQGVIKGGSFLCSPDWCMRYRAGARQPQDLDLATSHLGFRTILEVR